MLWQKGESAVTIRELCEKEVVQLEQGVCLGRADDLELDPATAQLQSLILLGRPRLFGLLGRDESLTMEERGEAVSEMERLAESGDMYAQYLMGKLWRDGPLLIPDSVEARYWFEQAAEQGHLVAQYSLAKLYLSDDVEVRDIRPGMPPLPDVRSAIGRPGRAARRLPYAFARYRNDKHRTASVTPGTYASAYPSYRKNRAFAHDCCT